MAMVHVICLVIRTCITSMVIARAAIRPLPCRTLAVGRVGLPRCRSQARCLLPRQCRRSYPLSWSPYPFECDGSVRMYVTLPWIL
jgi:hypothetical protein